jgi:hypothetical protein
MVSKKIELPSRMERLFGMTNIQSTPVPAIKIKYFVGIASTKSDTNSIEKRKESQNEAYAEISGKYGFSKISSVTAKAGYKYTGTTSEQTTTSTMTEAQMTTNLELEFDLGEISAGKGKFLYQPVLLDQGVMMNFSDLSVSEEPLADISVNVTIEGTSSELSSSFYSLQCLIDAHFTKTLSYYDGGGVYMGDSWILSDPSNHSGEWKLEPFPLFGKDIYWIIHKETGKLLSWYPGCEQVYAGDAWVMDKPDQGKTSSLWRVYPSDIGGNAYYIQSFMHPDKILSWYEGHRPYAGDDWVKTDSKAKLCALWRLTSA